MIKQHVGAFTGPIHLLDTNQDYRKPSMNPSELSILLVEDNPGDTYLIEQLLQESRNRGTIPPFTITATERLENGQAYLVDNDVSVVLLDLSLPDSLGLDTVRSLTATAVTIPIIVLTGTGDTRLATQAIHSGAQDYLIKGQFDANSLGRAIRYAIERNALLLDLKQKNQQLEASEKRRQEVMDHSMDGLIIVDSAGIIRYTNPAAEALLPASSQPLIGQRWPYAAEPNTITEIILQDEQGSTAVLELRVNATEWQNEPMSQIYLRDTTRQKMAEIARQESDERLRSTIASMDDLVFILDEDGRFQSYSHPQHSSHNRGTPTYIIGKSFREVLPPDVTRQLEPAIEAVKTSNWVRQIEYALSTGKRTYWFSAKVSPRHNHNNRFTGSTIVIRDISALKQAEAKLRHKNTQLENLHRSSLELSLELSFSELLQTVVRHAVELLEADGGSLYLYDDKRQDLFVAENIGGSLTAAGSRFKTGQGLAGRVWQQDSSLLVTNYRQWPHRLTAIDVPERTAVIGAPIRWQNDFIGVIAITSKHGQLFQTADTRLLELFCGQAAVALQNARLHAEVRNYNNKLSELVVQRTEELSQAYNKLKSLDELKNKFMADVSHELRTPVSNLNLYLTLLKRGSADKIPDYLKVLDHETTRLETLLEGILVMSRLDADFINNNFAPLSLAEVVEEVLISQRPFAAQKGLIITTQLSTALRHLNGSKKQLAEAIKHIIRNAILFSDDGEITVSLDYTPTHAHLQVRDQGNGISAADRPFIFDRFYRGQAVSQSPLPGIGLGLPISKAVFEMHSGVIDVDSTEGVGTAVTIKLPLEPIDAKIKPPPHERTDAGAP